MAAVTSDGPEPAETASPLLDDFVASCDSDEPVPDCFSPSAHDANTSAMASNNSVLSNRYRNTLAAVCKFISSRCCCFGAESQRTLPSASTKWARSQNLVPGRHERIPIQPSAWKGRSPKFGS